MSIDQRKADHIRINVTENVQFPTLTTGLERYRLVHQALPEVNLSEVCLEVALFGKRVHAPLLISSMTGGTDQAAYINRNLAEAAQAQRVAMGVGSQRAGIEHETVRRPSACATWRPTFCSSPTWARCSSTTATPSINAAAPWR